MSEDPDNKGGFVYEPGVSKAGEKELGDGKKALRSTGSISYAGLLSLIYAKLGPDDERVRRCSMAAGQLHRHGESRSRAAGAVLLLPLDGQSLTVLNMGELKNQGWQVDRLAHRNRKPDPQRSETGWIMVDQTGRWRESDAVYATALATLTSIHIHNSL